jgi:hypothetical protein
MVEFDQAEAHRFFSADCFNKAWTLIDMEKRTAEQDQEMIRHPWASGQCSCIRPIVPGCQPIG